MHQNLRRSRPGVVVGGHGKAIRTRAHYSQQFIRGNPGRLLFWARKSPLSQMGTDHVHHAFRPFCLAHRTDLMVSLVQAGADEVVHPGIHITKFLAALDLVYSTLSPGCLHFP